MRKPILGILVLLGATGCVVAQEASNVAVPFRESSAAHVSLLNPSSTDADSMVASNNSGDSQSFALATPSAAASSAASSAVPADPAVPAPKYVFGNRDDYRWQLGIGVEFFRFRSNLINASMVGENTTLTYFTNDWFAVEGSLLTAFAPTIYDREHVKYFSGAAGIRIGSRRARWEPWGHGEVGVGHLQPQTADNSRNSLTALAGIGVDYRVHSRLSFRIEGDWVYTKFFSQNQNNFQGVAGIVLHF
jgi:hypothetical protein